MRKWVPPLFGLTLCIAGSARADEQPPALAHLAAAGAQTSPQGTEHGLRTYLARSGNHFMVFDLTPDGDALVSGLLLQVSLKHLLSASGDRITELPRAHDLRVLFLRNGPQFQVFYATPDEERVIPGVMWDATGHNLTRQQIAFIPGTGPTVQLSDVPSAKDPSSSSDSGEMLRAVASTTSGMVGAAGAPLAWMFVDPQCRFSIRAMEELKPAIDQGRLRLAVIPLSILDHEDDGLSTKRALAMVGKPVTEMVTDWEQGNLSDQPVPDANQHLQTNMEAAAAVALRGTPTFFWRRKDGSVGRYDGVPPSPDALLQAIEAGA